jgi:hypothetical protein
MKKGEQIMLRVSLLEIYGTNPKWVPKIHNLEVL